MGLSMIVSECSSTSSFEVKFVAKQEFYEGHRSDSIAYNYVHAYNFNEWGCCSYMQIEFCNFFIRN